MITKSFEELINILELKLKEIVKIISIDGWVGVGKTSLAKLIKTNMNVQIISVDNFIEKNKGLYLEVLNYQKLLENISVFIKNEKPIILEGICINQIIEQIHIISDYKIYIKELNSFKIWSLEKYFDESKTIEEIFREDDEELKDPTYEKIFMINDENFEENILSKDRKGIFYDLVRYHRIYKPHLHNDIIFEREN